MCKLKTATIQTTTSRRTGDSILSKQGTLAELIEYYAYTLETGASYQHEKGNRKINCNPKTFVSLVSNLNKAKANAAANGCSNISYALVL